MSEILEVGECLTPEVVRYARVDLLDVAECKVVDTLAPLVRESVRVDWWILVPGLDGRPEWVAWDRHSPIPDEAQMLRCRGRAPLPVREA